MTKLKSKFKGRSGFDWSLVGSFDPATDVSTVLVTCGVDGSPVLSYTQAGTDKGSRKLLSAKTTESRTLARARADFGV